MYDKMIKQYIYILYIILLKLLWNSNSGNNQTDVITSSSFQEWKNKFKNHEKKIENKVWINLTGILERIPTSLLTGF